MELAISVVIATRNRVALLTQALDALVVQSLDKRSYEVIVVDNGSTDGTSAKVAQYSGVLPNIVCLMLEKPGASAARNFGWRSSHGKIVAFLDDDAIPAPDWLQRILGVFADVKPRPACVGGPVVPAFEVEPPKWLSGPLLDFLTVVDHSPNAVFLRDVLHRQKLASANMAIEREALDAVNGFHGSLDRVGDNLLSGGEVLVQLQLEKLGRGIYYDPAIPVRHHIAAGRVTAEWLNERAFWGGVSDTLLGFLNHKPNMWWAIRACSWSIRAAIFSPFMMLSLVQRSGSDARFIIRKCLAWHRLGSIVGALRALRLCVVPPAIGPDPIQWTD